MARTEAKEITKDGRNGVVVRVNHEREALKKRYYYTIS